jgi:hypothetical protein
LNINHIYSELNKELDRAEKIHPDWPNDIVYQVAIVSEESGELLKAVLDFKSNKAPSDDIIKEAIQTGAMILRFLKNIKI